MGGLLSCVDSQYQDSGETWQQVQSKWHPQNGVIDVDVKAQGNAGYNEQTSPLQPSPNLQMLQIPSPLPRPPQQPQHISPTEQATHQAEVQDHFPEDVTLPQAPVNWKRGDLIGAGAFGRVYLGMNNDNGELIAIKQVAVSKDTANAGRVAQHVRELEREVSVLKQLDHPNIVRYLGTDRSQDCLNIFLEYVPGGSIASLLSKFGSFKEKVIKIYARQILLGLQYLHDHKIMHRDIKGANILVDKAGFVKLADFGASKIIEDLVTIDSGVKSIKGTSYWMAPEVIKQTGHGRMADIWSVGCTVIEMATGKPPWSQFSSQVSAMFHIASSKGPPPIPDHLSPEAKDFLLLCFIRTPSDRPNAARLLKHPFLADVMKTVPSGPLSDFTTTQSPYRLQSPMRNNTERPPPAKDRPLPPAPHAPPMNHPREDQEFMRMYSPMANRLAAQKAERDPCVDGNNARPEKEQRQAGDWSRVADGNLRQSVASKASTRYHGVDDNEEGSNLDLDSRQSDSDYNPVEEPSWLQQDSLQASGFHFDPENSPPNSPLHNGLHKQEYAGPGRFKALPRKASQEGSLEDIMTFVKEKATQDVAQMSATLLPSRQQRDQGVGNGSSSKRQQWEAEILQELAEQRSNARRV